MDVANMQQEDEKSWVNYSELDKGTYTSLVTLFSTAASLLTHPLTVLVTRQQAGFHVTGEKPTSKNVLLALADSAKTIGMRGLFRGWVPVAVMGLPSQVVYLSIVEASREKFQHLLRTHMPDTPYMITDAIQATATSIISNGISLLPYVPAEVLSTRLITQGRSAVGTWQMSKQIWKENGMRGFFRGFNASLVSGVLFSSQWWYCYSIFRREAVHFHWFQKQPALMDSSAGLFAGFISTCCLHPLDTLKTRIMTRVCASGQPHAAPASLWGTFKDVVKKEGSSALWRGLSASLYLTMLSSAGFALMYELIKRHSKEVEDQA